MLDSDDVAVLVRAVARCPRLAELNFQPKGWCSTSATAEGSITGQIGEEGRRLLLAAKRPGLEITLDHRVI